MTETLLSAMPYGVGISLLAGALLLGIGGIALIDYARRMRREEISRRVDLVVENADVTVILERPKLKNYRQPIRETLARTLALEVDRVSVKFKTAEGVGPVGEGRSAEAQAIVTLSR